MSILIAATVESLTTRKDHTIKIVIGTQELAPDKGSEILSLMNKLCAVYISEKETVPQNIIDQVDELDIDLPGKTQSQRLRSVLYVLFSQDTEGYKTFDEFYHFKTDKIIDHLKTKIK
jgi:hypothetical protein